ncbi:hypothetical protein LS684_16120 [Cytobacillus spongiae]|uniref:hypothetical protein n=1 Tax=Cytobacillus spongiae TaxID=2901381 RepID=UPI001F25A5A5|nr:hypothetical protein [Cytobacillus spongiae]UII55167.1 hypothetical protein LS684_16120 [Cytobacillus spongiae]
MNKNRYLLCLLVCGLLLYYAAPRLSIFSEGAEGMFAITWLLFALFVIAGNLSALLYAPKQVKTEVLQKRNQTRKKVRSYQ